MTPGRGLARLLAIGMLVLSVSGCAAIRDWLAPPAPVPEPEPAPAVARAPAPVVTDPCGDLEASGQLGRLLDSSPEEQRREHLQAQQAFAADPKDANRRRLILTHALARSAWRDDARVQRLLESAEPSVREGPCATSLSVLLLRLSGERLRLLREEQRRHEVALKEEQRSSELNLREEVRRYEGLMRDEKARAEEFKLKLDALIEIDRRLRREAARPRR